MGILSCFKANSFSGLSVCLFVYFCGPDRASPCTVTVTLTSTEPSRFLATHSYSPVSSRWALLSSREPVSMTTRRSLAGRGRPWRDHSMTGLGSPSAWQWRSRGEPASTVVSTGSTVMEGAPGTREGAGRRGGVNTDWWWWWCLIGISSQ